MSNETTPSAGALRAAAAFKDDIWDRAGFNLSDVSLANLAEIIDRETGVRKLVQALEWAMDKEPSPCRCMDFATPPHVCRAHKALAEWREGK